MDLFQAINKRHSYRGEFTDDPVDKKDLKNIVQAGIQAPSGKNEQTTEFVIITDKSILTQIAQMHTIFVMNQAKAMILCITDVTPIPVYEGHSFSVEDSAAATENMLLAITALGYASVWIDGWLRLEHRAEKIAQIIGLPKTKKISILLPIGVAKEQLAQKQKKSFDQRAWFNKYKT